MFKKSLDDHFLGIIAGGISPERELDSKGYEIASNFKVLWWFYLEVYISISCAINYLSGLNLVPCNTDILLV